MRYCFVVSKVDTFLSCNVRKVCNQAVGPHLPTKKICDSYVAFFYPMNNAECHKFLVMYFLPSLPGYAGSWKIMYDCF